ncbi:MAG: phenylalanine--tRNA ligase beta subunit-related protein [Acidimicrobiales bacterium]|jgi:DNA/RNA-binding domain of Phe-tRNA-synthetase-like protein
MGDLLRLRVSDHVRRHFPDYQAIVVVARSVESGPSDAESTGMLREAESRARERLGEQLPSSLPEIAAWRATMAQFGCKPSRFPCSAEALLKRVARGDELPSINHLVDIYNAISITFAVPLGGEDIDQVRGDVVLLPASGDESFDGGDPPRAGEIVWRDDLGVTCRAWNWRQGTRTRITEVSSNVYFLLEAIEEHGAVSLEVAASDLCCHLSAVEIEATRLA